MLLVQYHNHYTVVLIIWSLPHCCVWELAVHKLAVICQVTTVTIFEDVHQCRGSVQKHLSVECDAIYVFILFMLLIKAQLFSLI